MAHSETAPENISRVSVDPREMESFSRMAEDWWNPDGMFKPLHVMNGARLDFIRRTIVDHFGLDPEAERPFEGLRVLDIGCGGGLLCEPMTRLGARVTGVDALEKNLKTAKTHALGAGLEIDYRHGTIEQLAASGEAPFDVVLNMEVIEHVANPPDFIADCAKMVRPATDAAEGADGKGGVMICSTINRTMKAFLFAIVGAEYILRWLPRGTHQYDKLVRPDEIRRYLEGAGLTVTDQIGMSLNPVSQTWRFGSDLSINYVTVAVR